MKRPFGHSSFATGSSRIRRTIHVEIVEAQRDGSVPWFSKSNFKIIMPPTFRDCSGLECTGLVYVRLDSLPESDVARIEYKTARSWRYDYTTKWSLMAEFRSNHYGLVKVTDIFEGVSSFNDDGIIYHYQPPNDGRKREYGKTPVFIIPCTEHNLEVLAQLPFINMGTQLEALKIRGKIALHKAMIPIVLVNQIGVEREDRNVHRWPGHPVPGVQVIEEKVPAETLSPAQRLAIGFGAEHPTEPVSKNVMVPNPLDPSLEIQKYSPKYELFSQQLLGAWVIGVLKRVALWYDMRLGKTATALAAALKALRDGDVKTIIVVCPTNNIYNPWVGDVQSFGLPCTILDGSRDADAEALEDRNVKVFILNYERVASRLRDIAAIIGLEDVFLIADETSAIKNGSAKQSKAFHSLSLPCKYVVMLNGTPIEQGPHDYWSQAHAIDPYGMFIHTTFGQFCERWLDKEEGKYHVKHGMRSDFEMMVQTTGIRMIRNGGDQFKGKTHSFRYVRLPATVEQLGLIKTIKEGYIKHEVEDGVVEEEEINDNILALYAYLRQVSAGYTKVVVGEKETVKKSGAIKISTVYEPRMLDINPKLYWLHAWLEANPTIPVILYVTFTCQENQLKHFLTENGHSYSSTNATGLPRDVRRLKRYVPSDFWLWIVDEYYGMHLQSTPPWFPPYIEDYIILPPQIYFDVDLVSFIDEYEVVDGYEFIDERSGYLDADALRKCKSNLVYDTCIYDSSSPLKPLPRSEEIRRFDIGETRIFILKHSQGRGLTLNRESARKRIGNPKLEPDVHPGSLAQEPEIIHITPTWSLGSFNQSNDRGVGTKVDSNHSTHTMVTVLTVKGSIEDKIVSALREKQDVQQTLLSDVKREGFSSFIEGLESEMEDGMKSSTFDVDEMLARTFFKIAPTGKITKRKLLNAAFKLLKSSDIRTKKQAIEFVLGGSDAELLKHYLKLKSLEQ